MSFLTDLERKIISTLKGRISKALNNSSSLREEEKVELEAVFQEIDNLILYKGLSFNNIKENFQKKLKETSSILKKSKKAYLKSHIVPLINKISTGKWEDNSKDE